MSGGVECGTRASRPGGVTASSPLGSKANASGGCLERKRHSAGGGEPSMRRNARRTWSAVRAGDGGSGTVKGVGEEVKEDAKKGDKLTDETLRSLEDRALGLISTWPSPPLNAEPENTSTAYATAPSRASSPERRTKAASARARTARHSANAVKAPYPHVGLAEACCQLTLAASKALSGLIVDLLARSALSSPASRRGDVPRCCPWATCQLGSGRGARAIAVTASTSAASLASSRVRAALCKGRCEVGFGAVH